MKARIGVAIIGSLVGVGGCTVGEKGSTPADTATGQVTSVAPATASPPTVSVPNVDTVLTPSSPAPTATKAAVTRTSTSAKVSTSSKPKSVSSPTPPPEPMMRDSAYKPRATVDDQGNIRPIKRDTLR